MQYTNTILMIEPVAFGFNAETAVNNYFQQQTENAQEAALKEFKEMVAKLKSFGVHVITLKDTAKPHTPDSIFPNNWVSFHQDGSIVIYPMYAENRRAERRDDIYDFLEEQGYMIGTIEDYSINEEDGLYLEGTGSIILDRENKIAFAAVSERTNEDLFLDFCEDMEYAPLLFKSFQTVEGKRLPIYHTNVMMCVADKYAVICLETIDFEEERTLVIDTLQSFDKEIIEITEAQMHQFAGNMLQVAGTDNKPYLVMSQSALGCLNAEQVASIERYNPIISVSIPTIEKNGGGSARCMMAEVFLPKFDV